MYNSETFKVARFLYYAGCLTIGQLTIRPALSFAISDWLFLCALIAVLIEILLFNRKLSLKLPSLFIVSILVFSTGGLLSLLNTNEKAIVLSVIARFIYTTLVWFWLGTIVLRNTNHIRISAVLWILSIAVNGLAATLQLLDPSIIPGTEPRGGRMVGFTGHPNDLGAMSAIAWGASTLFIFKHELSIKSSARFIVHLLIITGLILTGSTACLIAAFSATVYWLLKNKSAKKWIIIVFIIMSISMPVILIQHLSGGKSVIHRLNVTFIRTEGPTTLSMRVLGYKKAVAHIINNPLIGVGFEPGGAKVDRDGAKLGAGGAVHNFYIAAFYEAGVLGLIGMVLLTLVSINVVTHMIKTANRFNKDRYLVISLSAALVAFFVYSLSAPVLYQRYGWISLSLLFSYRAIVKRNVYNSIAR